jgi:carbonyl reductase 1
MYMYVDRIGWWIVKQLAEARPNWTILLGSRDDQRGHKAVNELGLSNVKPIRLVVDDVKQMQEAAAEVKSTYGNHPLQILMANAGWAKKGDAFDVDVVDETFRTNYYGLMDTINTFLPLMADKGRIVITSSASSVSALHSMAPELREKFLSPDLTVDGLTALLQQFRSDVANGSYQQKGWPKTAYGMSKVGASCLTRVLAKSLPRGITINCGCPGWSDQYTYARYYALRRSISLQC